MGVLLDSGGLLEMQSSPVTRDMLLPTLDSLVQRRRSLLNPRGEIFAGNNFSAVPDVGQVYDEL